MYFYRYPPGRIFLFEKCNRLYLPTQRQCRNCALIWCAHRSVAQRTGLVRAVVPLLAYRLKGFFCSPHGAGHRYGSRPVNHVGKKACESLRGLGHLMCRGSRSLSLSRKSDIACAAVLRSYSYRGRRHTLAQVFRTLKLTFVGSAGIAATGTPTTEEYRSFRLVGTGDEGYKSFTTIFRWS